MLAEKYDQKAILKEKEIEFKKMELQFQVQKFEKESEERKLRLELEMQERRAMLDILNKMKWFKWLLFLAAVKHFHDRLARIRFLNLTDKFLLYSLKKVGSYINFDMW